MKLTRSYRVERDVVIYTHRAGIEGRVLVAESRVSDRDARIGAPIECIDRSLRNQIMNAIQRELYAEDYL